ncbi:MAG: inositol monophosphatase family protein [Nocardioides sp.]
MELSDGQVALAAAEAGARVVRRHYRTAVERHLKVGTDFATDADLEAESAIRAVLNEHRPGDAQLGEEHGASGPESPRRWLIDPLCGTRNFAAGLPLSSRNVALEVDGVVSACAAAECVGDETYWSDGERTWVRRAGADESVHPTAESLMVSFDLEVSASRRRAFSRVIADQAFFGTYQPRVTLDHARAGVGRGGAPRGVRHGDGPARQRPLRRRPRALPRGGLRRHRSHRRRAGSGRPARGCRHRHPRRRAVAAQAARGAGWTVRTGFALRGTPK